MNISAELVKQTGKDPVCPYCNAPAVLRDASVVYGSAIFYGNLWVCSNYPDCDSYVGVHKNGDWMNYPLGVMADSSLREAKKLAHDKFDLLWKLKLMTRRESYQWLQRELDKDESQAHIGELSFEECLKVFNMAAGVIESQYYSKP